jgi:hypothetical protein
MIPVFGHFVLSFQIGKYTFQKGGSMTNQKVGTKSFWQLFVEWQGVRKDKTQVAKKKELEEKLANYLVDTLALRQELYMACKLTPMDEPLREVLTKRLEHTKILEEERSHDFDCENGEFFDLS